MRYDSSTLPLHLAVLCEQIAATEARIAQLDRELSAIRAGRLLDLPRRSASVVDEAHGADDTAADIMPWTGDSETPSLAVEAEAPVAPPTPQRGLRPLRQPSRPAKKHHHSHHRGH